MPHAPAHCVGIIDRLEVRLRNVARSSRVQVAMAVMMTWQANSAAHDAAMKTASPNVTQLLLIPADASKMLSIATRTLRAIRASDGFPKPVKLPGRKRMLRWRRSDVEEYIKSLPPK